MPPRHVVAVLGLGALLACDFVDRLRGGEVESPEEPSPAEPVAAAVAPETPPPPPSEQVVAPDALGSQVARIIDRERTPVAGPRGADLERVEQVTVTRMEGGWSQTTSGGTMRPEGVVFALDLDVEVGDEIGINQARLVAKATCKVGDEVRASSGDVFGTGTTAWGGATPISADPGKYEHAGASLFMQQDVVGHEPCQVELRMASPLSDKPMRVDGVWCLRDGKLGEGACEELAPPAEPPQVRVRDWKVDRTRRNIEVTLDVGERIWLDRTLVIRSSCDDGGERVPRSQLVWGPQWGLLDPGDSVRALASHWNGWFATTGPCELTAELWRRNDRGQWSGREEIGHACVEAFLPQEGRCPPSAPPPAGTGIVTLRKFEPDITRDPYDRRTRLIQATVEVVAHENLDGRYQLEFRGECGKGRGAVPLWLGGAADVDPAMLQAGEVMKAEYRSYLGRGSAGRCEVEAKLVPTDPAGAPISLGTTCFDERGTKPC